MAKTVKTRCQWAESNELLRTYHDLEWGVPVHDDRVLFEMLNLEGAQAGLSWLTILKKRPAYREAFDNFNAQKIAKYTERKRSELLNDSSIVRNRLKINAFIENSKAFLKTQDQFGDFDSYVWRFVGNKQLIPGQGQDLNPIAKTMSKDLKKRGFRFVGETICYSFMQSVGMVNDHSKNCSRFKMISRGL